MDDPFDLDHRVDMGSGTLHPAIYTSEAIYQRELEAVFARAWLFLCHESQIAEPGDYFLTYMGEDPVIVTRQADGAIKVFLNQCRHRSMRLCNLDSGNTRRFTCPYHGWTYNADGRLLAVPHEKEAYRDGLDKARWSLRETAQVASYKGLVFATWDAAAPALEDYLGDIAWYLDSFVDRLEGGTIAFGGLHKWVIDCNWKLAAEQFISDQYHTITTHASSIRVLTPPKAGGDNPLGAGQTAKAPWEAYRDGAQFGQDGHGSGFYFADKPDANVWVEGEAAQWFRDTYAEAEARLGRRRALRLAGHNGIFPNLAWLNGTATLRVWHPRGPDRTEVWAWCIVDARTPEPVRQAFQRSVCRTFGPGGIIEQDDTQNWIEVQKVLRGHVARGTDVCVSMGLGHERRDAGGLPGTTNYVLSETAARSFYQRWKDMMLGKDWAELQTPRSPLMAEAARA